MDSSPCKGIRIPESEKFLPGNPEYGKILRMESRIQLKESEIPLKIGIQNPRSTDKKWNPVPGIRNPGRGIQNPTLFYISAQVHQTTVFCTFSVLGEANIA